MGSADADGPARTCSVTTELSAVPTWSPSPDSVEKRQVAEEIRSEIEAEWKDLQHIVLRDINLSDGKVTFCLTTPNGLFFNECDFRPAREPHLMNCKALGEHPVPSVQERMLETPYRLK